MNQLSQLRKLSKELKVAYSDSDVHGRLGTFDGWLDRAAADGNEDGADTYDHAETVREYYNLCSDFMVFGWSESLHFAPLSPTETLEESQIRHQRQMISRLELREGMKAIDVGCGLGGPLRRVVREAGVAVVGINTSDVQLRKARALDAEAGIEHMVDYLECSFMDMDAVADETFDRGWAIESTCHAPDKAGAFAEIYRVLKPGALLWGQEMCLTDEFDPDNSEHQAAKRDLMHGIALKHIATFAEVNADLEAAGFEVVEGRDQGAEADSPTPWHLPLETQRGTLGNALLRLPMGRKLIQGTVRLAEIARVFPKGSADVVAMMDNTAHAYAVGGRTGIFTPLYCFLARKPD